MTIYGWDGGGGDILLPAAGGTVNSAGFSVPKGAISMTVHCPTTGGAATISIEALAPNTDQATEVWRAVNSTAGATPTPLSTIAMSNTAMVFPVAAFGGGVLRFVASSTQAGAPLTLKVVFHMQG